MNHPRYCPKCGTLVEKYSNPKPTADVVIYDEILGYPPQSGYEEPSHYFSTIF